MSKTFITALPTIGRVLTPVAMLVALTYEIVTSQDVTGGWLIAVHIGAAATAVGIEAVGILSGHVFEGFWRIGDRPRAAVAFGLLLIYTAAGLFILRDNPALLPIPVIAAVVYLVAGLAESLAVEQTRRVETAVTQNAYELAEAKKDREFERQQIAADKESERQLKHIKAEAAAAAKLARIEAKAQQVSPETKEKAQPKPAQLDELSGKALEIYQALTGNPAATNTEIAETVGVSRQYVAQVRRSLNGHVM